MRGKILLGLVIGVAPASALAAQTFDARSLGRGGTGLTMGEYNQALANPALINQHDRADDFSFSINVGVIASDKDGILEDIDEVGDELDDLENGRGDPGRVDAKMQAMNGKVAQVDAGGALMVGVPNQRLPLALILQTKARVGATTVYSQGDSAKLQDPNFDQEDLASEVMATGVETRELGMMFGYTSSWSVIEGVDFGATVKYQKITLIHDVQKIGSFETDDVLNSNNTEEKSGLNLDLGAHKAFGDAGQYRVAATVENLIPRTIRGARDEDYDMTPVLTIGGGYHTRFIKLEAGLDLTERAGFGLVGDSRFFNAGAELSAGRHAHLRAGYRADLNDEVSDVLTLGFGITPYDTVSLDLAALKGEGDTYGAALQLGIKF